MKRVEVRSYPVSIFIAGDAEKATRLCRHYCDDHGFCVTVTPTTYVYTDGQEGGVIIGLINYPRFPAEPESIRGRAFDLAMLLRCGLSQESFTIQTPERTEWISFRAADCDTDGTRSAETACPAPVPQDCQAGAEGIAETSPEQS